MATRFVLVDDTDPAIRYDGAWVADKGSRDRIGNFGTPYQSTLHGTRQSGSLSFPFSGTQVWLVGSNNIRNDSNVIDPHWECFLDGASIGAKPLFRYPENNWFMCDHATPFKDGPHVLTLNITITKGTAFWFDYILYAPSRSVPLYDKKVFIEPIDPEISTAMRAAGGWGKFGDHANMTSVPGTKIKFDFTGSALEWFGGYAREYPHESSTATYSIDGQRPVSFSLRGLTGEKASTAYHQKLFETTKYPYGNHSIEVVYEGTKTPLLLDYVIVHSNETSAAMGEGGSTVPTGALVGGAVGAVVALIFVALAVFFYLRSRRGHRFQPLSLFDFNESNKPPSPTPFAPPKPSKRDEPPIGSVSPFVVPPTASNFSTSDITGSQASRPAGDRSLGTSMYTSLHTQSSSSLGVAPVANPENLFSPGNTVVLPFHNGPPPLGKQALGMTSDHSLAVQSHSRSGSSSADSSRYGYNPALAPVRNPENLFSPGATAVLPVHSGPPPLGKQALGMMSDHSLGASTQSRADSSGDSSRHRYNPALAPVRNPENLFSPGATPVLPVHSGPIPFGKQALGMASDHSLTHSRNGSSFEDSSRQRYDPVGNPDNIFSPTEGGTVLLPYNSGQPPPGKRALDLTSDPRRRPRGPAVSMYSDTSSSLSDPSRYPPPRSRSRRPMPSARPKPARVVVHTDSGLRLNDMDTVDDRTSIISEIPPQYTTR